MLSLVMTCLLIQAAPVSFTVMSFNIRYDNPDDGESAWHYRVDRVAREIAKAELIGAQEALSHQIEQLDAKLPGYEWVGVGRDDGKESGEFAPVFFKTAVFELLEFTTLWLSEIPDQPGSVGWDAALPRIATSVHLRIRGTDHDLQVINTHFDHRGAQARLQSARLLIEYVRAFDRPVVLVGDLNATPDTDVLSVFTEGELLYDTRSASQSPPDRPFGTFSGFLERDQLNDAPRIDYILVSNDWKVNSYEAVVSIQDGRYVSDHLPVRSQLQLVD